MEPSKAIIGPKKKAIGMTKPKKMMKTSSLLRHLTHSRREGNSSHDEFLEMAGVKSHDLLLATGTCPSKKRKLISNS